MANQYNLSSSNTVELTEDFTKAIASSSAETLKLYDLYLRNTEIYNKWVVDPKFCQILLTSGKSLKKSLKDKRSEVHVSVLRYSEEDLYVSVPDGSTYLDKNDKRFMEPTVGRLTAIINGLRIYFYRTDGDSIVRSLGFGVKYPDDLLTSPKANSLSRYICPGMHLLPKFFLDYHIGQMKAQKTVNKEEGSASGTSINLGTDSRANVFSVDLMGDEYNHAFTAVFACIAADFKSAFRKMNDTDAKRYRTLGKWFAYAKRDNSVLMETTCSMKRNCPGIFEFCVGSAVFKYDKLEFQRSAEYKKQRKEIGEVQILGIREKRTSKEAFEGFDSDWDDD